MKSFSASSGHGVAPVDRHAPSGQAVMDHTFFLSDTEWERVRAEEHFDYIVIGSGFCALGFVSRMLENNPHARVLIIERGTFFLPEHFQNMPQPYQKAFNEVSEVCPWSLSSRMCEGEGHIKWQRGIFPFLGGESTVWSGWCPRPTREEMTGWPGPVIDAAYRYFDRAEQQLNVISADKIGGQDAASSAGRRPVYGILQEELTRLMHDQSGKIDSCTRAIAAPLAVASQEFDRINFRKFSVPGPLLSLVEKQRRLALQQEGAPLRIVTNCAVTRILQEGKGTPTALETTRGLVNVANAKIILAMSTLPATTLVLNSFPQVRNAGKRFTAHFISAVVARVRREDFPFHQKLEGLELAALYMAGADPKTKGHYHVQLTAMADADPVRHASMAVRYLPDVLASASSQQLQSSKDHVLFSCAILGEIDYRNEFNWLRRLEGGDPTSNVILQVVENENDKTVWDTMEQGAFQALERVLSPKGLEGLEYWHETPSGPRGWRPERPSTRQIRIPTLVHEASTLWIGDDEDAVVGLDYQLKGARNVYVTGGALWPTGASWNPTMTMVALSMHLADLLTRGRKE